MPSLSALDMSKLRRREVKAPGQGHRAGRGRQVRGSRRPSLAPPLSPSALPFLSIGGLLLAETIFSENGFSWVPLIAHFKRTRL